MKEALQAAGAVIYQIAAHRLRVCPEVLTPDSDDGWLLLEGMIGKDETAFLRGSVQIWIDSLLQEHPHASPRLLGTTAGSLSASLHNPVPVSPEQTAAALTLRKQSWCFHLALTSGAPLALLNVVDDAWMHDLLMQHGYVHTRANAAMLGHSTTPNCERWSLFDDRGQLLTKFDIEDGARPEQRARVYLAVLQTLASQERVPWPLFAATVLPDQGPWNR